MTSSHSEGSSLLPTTESCNRFLWGMGGRAMLPADLRLGRLSRLRGGMPTSAPLTLKTSLQVGKWLRGWPFATLNTAKVCWAASPRQVRPCVAWLPAAGPIRSRTAIEQTAMVRLRTVQGHGCRTQHNLGVMHKH